MERPSPLSEIDPAVVQEFFSKDPLDLTDAELDMMIEHMRANRKNWLAAEAAKATAEKKPRAKGPAIPLSPNQLKDLEDSL